MISLVLVLLTIAVVAVVRRKISRASNSPSSQLELINNQKQDLDYSPDIIPKDSGIKINKLYNMYGLREAFKKKKKVGFFPPGGGGGGSTPNPHFFVKNKHGLKMCFKSF